MPNNTRKRLYAEMERLQLMPPASLDVLLDAFTTLEAPEKGDPTLVRFTPLSALFSHPDHASEYPPPLPAAFDMGRASAEMGLVDDAYGYVLITRSTPEKLAIGSAALPKATSRRICVFFAKGHKATAFVRMTRSWQPLENQLGPDPKQSTTRLMELLAKVGGMAIEHFGQTDDEDTEGNPPSGIKPWSTNDLNNNN